ncbi:MAG: T9SS type A sorting domain-containing protein, partial [Ignavibacteriales bacterium]|nr:T9SS type A sorting domain-containing protein [Ignavibacteriales bacterium]
PYPNGRTPYLGGVTSVSGIVTADTSDILITPLNTGGTSSWYIQDGTAPWNGLWVVSKDSSTRAALSALRRGDSVTVTGTIQENFDVTRILDSLVTIHASGRPVPAPVTITTGTFGLHGNGDPNAEPYEGMLVRMVNAQVKDTTQWTFADRTEYVIDDGTGPVIVRRDGVNTYGNREADTSLAKTHIIHPFDPVDTLIGIGYFSFSRYKIDPRRDDDFVAGDPDKYAQGWNMASIGRTQMPVSGYAVSSYFPGAVSSAFYFAASAYHPTTTLDNKIGYWVKFPSAKTIHHLGAKRTRDTITVVQGWNLVGALGDPVLTNTVAAYPPGNHLSAFFEYSNGYFIQDSLIPSKGYWVKSDSNGSIVEALSSMMPKTSRYANIHEFNTLAITDRDGNSQTLYFGEDAEGTLRLSDYDMPPFSPATAGEPAERMLDVRYASGRILESYPSVVKDGMTFTINVSAQNSPLTVQWNIVSQDGKSPGGKRFRLGSMENGVAFKELTGSGKMLVVKSGSFTMSLTVEGGANVPKAFALSQNYPNPFNPTTTFEVALPVTTHLDITIYNVLGQKVNTLVDGIMDAGYHTIQWNGTAQNGNAASTGVYFVRMNARQADGGQAPSGQAGAFTAIRKMVLMK